ncbi:GmrSD restriction endonuclease domain-containing protein [Deinococcus radiophilus]
MTQAQDQARSESLKQLVAQLEAEPPVVLLPEFQRDFVWEMEQTYALFDSLIRGIFVGSVIYGKPSFELSLREVDKRPRKGPGSRAKIGIKHYTEEEMKHASQQDGLKILLDGQQRTTSLYRALRGIDKVYYVVQPGAVDLKAEEFAQKSLEDLMHDDNDDFDGIQGSDSAEVICVPLDYAFEYMLTVPRERDVEKFFREQTERGKALAAAEDQAALNAAFEVFLQVLSKLKTMYEQQQLLSYYLLDMELEKFTTFFERSNSKGIQLNFTDVLAAKVFGKFNLRQQFDKFADTNPDISVNRELMVRAIALMTGRFDKIEKGQLLKRLTADDFVEHWDEMTGLLKQTLEYLHNQKLLVAIRWLPYDNMLLPLMMFFKELNRQGDTSPSQQQWDFLQWWYWAVIFSERYTAATNEKIVQDSRVLQRVARNEPLDAKAFARFRPTLEVDDLLTYTRSSSAVYRGVFNLIHFMGGG